MTTDLELIVRRPLLAVLAVAVLASTATVPSTPASLVSADPGPGYFATSNIEWLGNIALNSDSAGARFHDGHLYVTEDRGLTIYDLSDPALPVPTGFWPSPQAAYVSEEDVDTNGEILLVGMYEELLGSAVGPLDRVNIIDVSNKNLPVLLSSIEGADEHTISCVWDCAWAWGSAGTVVDLRDPSAPALAGNWWSGPDGLRAEVEAMGIPVRRGSAHDITEVAPGLIVTSTNPVIYARVDPDDATDADVLHVGELPDGRFIHGNLWPNGGVDPDSGTLVDADDVLLVGGETSKLGPSCGPNDGALMAYDATAVNADEAAIAAAVRAGDERPARTARFRLIDEWRVPGGGLYSDGNAPYNQFCAHWFTPRPGWDNGGTVAAAWYEHGVRFLEVDPTAEDVITEVGWFVPLGGSTSAAYWVGDDIVYTTDYQRGIDILRFTEPAPGEVQEVVEVGLASEVATRAIDPDSFFPWYGNEAVLAARGVDPYADDGYAGCRIPITRV